jgi:hypothetical protein
MVGHQAVGEDWERVPFAGFLEHALEGVIVFGLAKEGDPAIAYSGRGRQDHRRCFWHAWAWGNHNDSPP